MTTIPTVGLADDWLNAPAPTYITEFLSASMPRPADTTTVQTAESPPPKIYMAVADQSYRVLFETHSPASNIVSDVRPQITVAIVVTGDNELAILRAALRGGTVALLLPDNRTVTMQKPRIEAIKFLDREFPDFPKSTMGNRIAVLTLSSDSRFYRST
jgi:hypothetical protein